MYSMRPVQKTIPSFRPVACPGCNKPRLLKEIKEDGTLDPVSTEQVDVRGEQRFTEVCGPCVQKYARADQRFVMENLKKIQKAMSVKSIKRTDEDASGDHNDFSLDL